MGKHRPNYHRDYYQTHKEYWQNRVVDRKKDKAIHKKGRQNRLSNGQCLYCIQARLPNNQLCLKHWFIGRAWANLQSKTVVMGKKLEEKLISQNYRCPYTNEILIPGINCHLDHIYPKHRFPELSSDINNVEWVSEKVNLAKRVMTKKEFIDFCKTVCQNTAQTQTLRERRCCNAPR